MDKDTTWKKGKKPKGETPEAQFLGHNHHRFAVYVELEDVLEHMEDLPEKEAKAFEKAWKKAEKEKKKAAEKAEKDWLKTCVLVTRFTEPFLKKLKIVLQSCASDGDDVTQDVFGKLMADCANLFTFYYDYFAFMKEFHAVFPTLKEYLKSNKKDKDAKHALEFFQKWHDVCFEKDSDKPKDFLQVRSELFADGMAELGL